MKKYSFNSKIGRITLFSKNEKINQIILQSDANFHDEPNEAIKLAQKEILEYFDNLRTEFTFPIEFDGSSFRKEVLNAMMKIPYGEVMSYSDLAKSSGHFNADRAVGTVCKNNPLPLIIPCHRVIKKNGDIGNFYGGVELKALLINHEKKPS